ncbi:unnamed protein product [Mytilus coruscus]|uniref:C-type lectin domain-containing protein n=1 Tax=Mytilus coruscus TaxID=42192 RepID=A0A6J8CQZ8_MYTCO|nr:unnamed protein product [Mytilus coruscus]
MKLITLISLTAETTTVNFEDGSSIVNRNTLIEYSNNLNPADINITIVVDAVQKEINEHLKQKQSAKCEEILLYMRVKVFLKNANNKRCLHSSTWIGRENHCVTIGGNLAEVKGTPEHEYILNLLSGTSSLYVWIGGRHHIDSGKWIWNTTSEEILVPHKEWPWEKLRPDNHGGNQHCLTYCHFPGLGYLWDDRECTSTNSFICDL